MTNKIFLYWFIYMLGLIIVCSQLLASGVPWFLSLVAGLVWPGVVFSMLITVLLRAYGI